MHQKYIQALKAGKSIRIIYNKRNHDWCEEDGWWSEELWQYNRSTDIFECRYPVSSYEKSFFTTHTQDDVILNLRDAIRDADSKYGKISVTDIIIEDDDTSVSSLSIREQALEKIKTMSDEELKLRLLI